MTISPSTKPSSSSRRRAGDLWEVAFEGLLAFRLEAARSPTRCAMQRKPSYFGSYCQPSPAGSSSTGSASIGLKSSGKGAGKTRRRVTPLGTLAETARPRSRSDLGHDLAQRLRGRLGRGEQGEQRDWRRTDYRSPLPLCCGMKSLRTAVEISYGEAATRPSGTPPDKAWIEGAIVCACGARQWERRGPRRRPWAEASRRASQNHAPALSAGHAGDVDVERIDRWSPP